MRDNRLKDFCMQHFKPIFDSHSYYVIRCFQRSLRYYCRYRFGRLKKTDVFYFVINSHREHPGLADRLKAIISAYNEAKKNGLTFKLIFTSPFNLEDYLLPATKEYDWTVGSDVPEYIIGKTHFIKEHTGWSIPAKKGHQYHCYFYAGNDLPVCFENTGWKWHDLFAELFKPSDVVMQAVDAVGLKPRTYCAVHLRFVNALENFEFGYHNSLHSEREKEDLINRCKMAIASIAEKTGQNVVVFSDSRRFLSSIEDLPVIVLDPSNIGHISHLQTGGSGVSASVLKAFLDMFVISRASKVYKIKSKEMYWWSDFALCGARMGDVEFEEIEV